MIFLGALLWSLNAPLVKFIQLEPMMVCGLRSIIAGVVLAPFIRSGGLKWNRWMVMYLISYAGLCISIITALNKTSAAIAIGMQYTAMIWLFLVALLKKEPFRWGKFLPVLLILVGIVFFMSSRGAVGSSSTGNLIALSEGIFFACMTISSPHAAGTNPLGLTAVANLFTGLAVFAFFKPLNGGFAAIDTQNWIIILVLGIIQVGGGYSFYNMGLRKTTPQKASIIALWEMIFGPVWVALFLHEYPNLGILIGFAIIIIGMLLDSLQIGAKNRSTVTQ